MNETTPATTYEYQQSHPSRTKGTPYVEIVEQPAPNTLRFRYACENRSAGCIIGVNSTPEKKTYPSIKVHGYQGKAKVLISCVTKDDPPKPHPHSIIGKGSCKNGGVCIVKVNVCGDIISFNNIGIQCIKKKEVREALAIRERVRVDPFFTGYKHMDFPDLIDVNAVRLAFQVFVPGPDGSCTVPLKPVATCPIYDKKAVEELVIVKLSHNSAPASGGTSMILLCGKVSKDDIQVRFFEMRDNWLFWDGYGEFCPAEVHKQVAISFRTPKYCNQDIAEPVTVFVQLRKKSDGRASKPIPFQILPLDVEDSLKRKRIRLNEDPRTYIAKHIKAQAEKQSKVLNQTLLMNLRDNKQRQTGREMNVPFRDGETHPRPTPIFQGQTSSLPVPQATQERINYNIPFNQQHNYEREDRCYTHDEISAPEPQNLTLPSRALNQAQRIRMDVSFNQQLHNLEREDRSYTHDEIPAPEPQILTFLSRGLNQAQGRMDVSFNQQVHNLERENHLQNDHQAPPAQPLRPPRPQPRHRTETPPPNVTINSYVYLEPQFANYRQPEPQPTPQMVMDPLCGDNSDDPFTLKDLPSNIDQLSQQDLQLDLLGTTDSNDISENLSETLSKGLSISGDHIEFTFQNIHELNNEVQACQQQAQVQFADNTESWSAVGPSYNPFARPNFHNHIG